jgi:hypothetical protein
MAKNFATIYSSTNDAISLDQKFFVKTETTRGELIAPVGTDYLYTLAGGAIEFSQPFESSPHRSGRHHNNIIKKKKETNWNFSTYFNIDTTLGAAAAAEIDAPVKALWKSMMGNEDLSSGAKYLVSVPDITFSIFENGDKWARQARGCFVQGANMTLPGDGEATTEWSGSGKDALYLGIGKSVTANAANAITLASGDGAQFKNAIGGLVMVVKSDGTTRSSDTPSGSPRKIVSVVGDVVTVDGAALTDSDGTTNPVYLCYYEPTGVTGIDNPVTGLTGSLSLTGYSSICPRSISINLQNNHELVNYCYGESGLSGPLFVPGDRMTAEISLEFNVNKEVMKLFNGVQSFDAQTIQVILGDVTGRHLDIDIPRAIFSVPSFSVPDTGSVPVTFTGTAYQTAFDAADEISVHFK